MSQEPVSKDAKELVTRAVAPIRDAELRRDLWPQMLEKLRRQPVSIPWFDWALAALAGAALLFFPGIIPALFYHL
jgi:hypothetical protein